MTRLQWNLPRLSGRGLAVAGATAIAAGLFLPWFQVPQDVEVSRNGSVRVSMLRPACEVFFKGAVALTCILVLFLLRGGRWRIPGTRSRAMASAAVTLVGVGLYFPQWVILCDPELSHAAAALEEQHDSLVWFGGDIYTAREFTYLGQGMPVDAKDMPAQLAAVPLPNLEWDLIKVHEFLAWSGFTPAYWEFVCPGWAFTMLGCAGVLLAAVGTRGGDERTPACQALKSIAIVGAVFFALTAVRVVGASLSLSSAGEAMRAGELQSARDHLDRACFFFPCLEFDTAVLLQKGRIDCEGGSSSLSSEAALYQAFRLESRGFTHQSAARYGQLSRCEQRWVAREASRCLLRLAIDSFNAGKYLAARRSIGGLLASHPTSVKLLYLGLLSAHQHGELAEAERLVAQLTAVYTAFQMPEKRGVIATAHGILAELRFNAGDAEGALQGLRNQIVLP